MKAIRGCLLLVVVSLIAGCLSPHPIRVGFTGELTGKQADLGVHGRNGVQLAVESINAAGGIDGRPIELLVHDDLGTPEGAQAADRALIEAGVVAIIGHMTSGQTMAAIPIINDAEVVLISPTTSTYELSGLDDYFFRVNPDNLAEARILARRVCGELGLSRVTGIYDVDNAAYTRTFWTAFVETCQALGQQAVAEVVFSAAEASDLVPLVSELRSYQPDALIIIAAAWDTALIAQQTRLQDWPVPLFATGWSHTETLLQNGGRAIEGMEMIMSFDLDYQADAPTLLDKDCVTQSLLLSASNALQAFKTCYQQRFGQAPIFASAQAYEAMMVLMEALKETRGNARGLPDALTSIKDYEGLNTKLSLDEYGDVIRPQFLVTVRDGEFVTLGMVGPEYP
jgi:branched-chain amino acid transport system substrate-binding protein